MPFTASLHLCALAATGALALSAVDFERPHDTPAAADEMVSFAAPVRLMAGDEYLGTGRMYPSPAVHDWNGDGRNDVLIGDLHGRVTVALRGEDGALGAEAKAKTRDDELLDFGNW